MSVYSLSHLPDERLRSALAALVSRDRTTTAELLAHVAESDARKLYLPEAYPSMYDYCVGELRMSEDMACRRIRAARAAREFPALLPALAEGRLHLTAVVMLAPHLTGENADELLQAATHKTKVEVEQLLTQRVPRPEVPTRIDPVARPEPPAPGPVGLSALARMAASAPQPTMAPIGPQRFVLQVTIDEETSSDLLYARALLGHSSADMGQLLRRAAKLLVHDIEKRKFGATSRPRRGQNRAPENPRHVPAHVKRTVWERDGGRCTFTSEAGRRCEATSRLEFDHAVPVARGGQATVDNIRIRCRAHNQYGAEQAFGADFMRHKREEAQRTKDRDVVPWLRQLGFRMDEARRAAAHCESMSDAPLEERVRMALAYLAPPHRRVGAPSGAGTS